MTAANDRDRDEHHCGLGLNPDPDFSDATDDPRVEAHLELIWTVLSRAVDNRTRWDHIDEHVALTMFYDVYLGCRGLTGDEFADLELFESDLSKDRTPDRSYSHLTATENSFISILEVGANRLADADLDAEWNEYRERVSGGSE